MPAAVADAYSIIEPKATYTTCMQRSSTLTAGSADGVALTVRVTGRCADASVVTDASNIKNLDKRLCAVRVLNCARYLAACTSTTNVSALDASLCID